MDTQTILTVAVVVNVVIALVAVAWPRTSIRRSSAPSASSSNSFDAGRSAAEPAATVSTTGAGSASLEPASASLSSDAPIASANGHHVDRPAGDAWARVEPQKDPATGFDLPPAWSRWIAEEEARVRRFHRAATVVIVELAGIDRLVERLGLETAQRLIPPIAVTMRRNGREVDHFVRLGSSRFGVLLTETNEIAAINYVERIRAACDLWLASGAVALHLAIGWAEINQGQNGAAAIEEAEQRLFADRDRPRGKAAGRVRGESMVPKAARAAS